jgi:hypothetical protein
MAPVWSLRRHVVSVVMLVCASFFSSVSFSSVCFSGLFYSISTCRVDLSRFAFTMVRWYFMLSSETDCGTHPTGDPTKRFLLTDVNLLYLSVGCCQMPVWLALALAALV